MTAGVENAERAAKKGVCLNILSTFHHQELPGTRQPGLLRRVKGQEIVACPEILYLLYFYLLIEHVKSV